MPYLVPAVDRTVVLLTFLRNHKLGRATLSEICHATGTPRSSSLNILRTLEAHGFVRFDPESKKFSLGWALVELGARASQQLSHLEVVRPYLHLLEHALDLTCVLGQRLADQAIITDKVESARDVVPTAPVGQLYPLSAGALGKAMLAFQEEEEILSYVRFMGLPSFTEFSITRADDLLRELVDVRRLAYAISIEEYTRGVVAVAAPVFDVSGRVALCVGALGRSVLLPAPCLPEIGATVRETARQMTVAVGGTWRGPEIVRAIAAGG